MKRIVLYLGIFLLLLFIISDVSAQQRLQDISGRPAARYFIGTVNEILVPINIWGFVRYPGQYMVPNRTDLLSLISYAGGPTDAANISKIRLVRSDEKEGNIVWNVNIKKYLKTGDQRLIPILKAGDTIIVKGTTFHWISKFFEFISRMAVFAQIFYFIAIAQEYLSKK